MFTDCRKTIYSLPIFAQQVRMIILI